MPVTLICNTCGKEFKKPKSQSHYKFCSLRCWYKYSIIKNSAKREKRKCEFCNKEYEYVKNKNGKRFCSPECRYAAWKGENNPRYNKESKTNINCANCGKEFIIYKSWIKNGDGKYCSKKCQYEHRSEIYTGENSANWKGGVFPDYGRNWKKQRSAARKRDNYTCQHCGITEKEIGRQLDVHHIKTILSFSGDWDSANKIDNLISLCNACHRKAR